MGCQLRALAPDPSAETSCSSSTVSFDLPPTRVASGFSHTRPTYGALPPGPSCSLLHPRLVPNKLSKAKVARPPSQLTVSLVLPRADTGWCWMQATAQRVPAGWCLPRCDPAVYGDVACLIQSNSLDPVRVATCRGNDLMPVAFCRVKVERVYADVRRGSPGEHFSPSDAAAMQTSGSTTMKAERFAPPAPAARPPSEMQHGLKGGIASLSPADRAAVAARAAAALMQRANAAGEAPMHRSLARAKEAAGAGQHDWASADWIAESMADTVDSFSLDSAMGPMDGDGYDFQCGNDGGFEGGWLPGEDKYAHADAPISAADFGDLGGGFGSPFESGSLQRSSFALVPDITAAGPPDHAYGGLPTSFLSDTRFPMPVSPDLPLAYGGLPAAAAHPAALRANSCSDPAHVPSLMVVNVPVGYGGFDAEADEEPASDDGTGSPDGRSQRLAARAARAARRAAAGSDDSNDGPPEEDGALPLRRWPVVQSDLHPLRSIALSCLHFVTFGTSNTADCW